MYFSRLKYSTPDFSKAISPVKLREMCAFLSVAAHSEKKTIPFLWKVSGSWRNKVLLLSPGRVQKTDIGILILTFDNVSVLKVFSFGSLSHHVKSIEQILSQNECVCFMCEKVMFFQLDRVTLVVLSVSDCFVRYLQYQFA